MRKVAISAAILCLSALSSPAAAKFTVGVKVSGRVQGGCHAENEIRKSRDVRVRCTSPAIKVEATETENGLKTVIVRPLV